MIEVLLSLSLLATILFFTIPFDGLLYRKNQAQVIQNDLQRAIHYAKMEALTRGKNVILKPLLGSNDWSRGLLLLVDNATHSYLSSEQLIHEWHWKSSGIHVSWRGFQSKYYLLFSADPNQNNVNGTFLIHYGLNNTIQLSLNKLGRIRH